MKWESRFSGEYISAAELGDKRPTFTITRVTTTNMEEEGKEAGSKKKKSRGVIWFKELDRPWLYCKTAGHCLASLFGPDDDNWVGKRVTLYADPSVVFQSEQVGGIRIAGSPDIAKTLKVRIKFPKKRAIELELQPTKAATPASTAPSPA